MPTTNLGWPFSSEWRNYRYKLKYLTEGTHYTINGTPTGSFDTNGGLDIWMDSDLWARSDAEGVSYKIVMENGVPDRCKRIFRPKTFIEDGGTGQCTDAQATGITIAWFKVGADDDHNNLDIVTSEASTIGSTGYAQSLHMVAPGLYFSFKNRGLGSNISFGDDDEFEWTMIHSSIANEPKVMDGTWIGYLKMPREEDDITFSQPLPSMLSRSSLHFSFNCAPEFPKATETGAENGAIDIILQGSHNGEDFVDIRTMVDEHDWRLDGTHFNAVFDTNAADGNDLPYKRLKIVNPDMASASSLILQPHNYIQVAITPY